MSAGNRPLPGISAIPGINKIPGFGGQSSVASQGRQSGGLGVVNALAGGSQYQLGANPQYQQGANPQQLGAPHQLGASPQLGAPHQLGASPQLGAPHQLGASPQLGATPLYGRPDYMPQTQPPVSNTQVGADPQYRQGANPQYQLGADPQHQLGANPQYQQPYIPQTQPPVSNYQLGASPAAMQTGVGLQPNPQQTTGQSRSYSMRQSSPFGGYGRRLWG